MTLDYRVMPRLSVGLEATPGRGEVLPRGGWFITPETRSTPSVVLGFTADRLSTSEGHAVFLTLGKIARGSPITPFASVKYATVDGAVAYPFGANVDLAPGWVVQGLHDGRHNHLILTRVQSGTTVSLLLARTRYPGLQLGVGF